MPERRTPQLAYSESQALMTDETSRRTKAAKMAAVIQHFLGRDSLDGLTVLDVGCSGGIVADELHRRGARMVGLDIDVPGLAKAQRSFAGSARFVCADSQRMPFEDASFDVVVCNHVYEHVVDPHRVFDELRRIVKPEGVLYLGLANRLVVIEPHYRLPFLSWLPRRLAHCYVRASGRADHYHEAMTTRRGLVDLCRGLHAWDYTFTVLADPARFAAGDVVPRWATRIPLPVFRAFRPLVPTYLWVGTTKPADPQGPPTTIPPARVETSG